MRVIVIGGGGHAKVVISLLKKLSGYDIVGYTDAKNNGDLLSSVYLGNDDVLKRIVNEQNIDALVVGVGQIKNAAQRRKIVNDLEELNVGFPALVSPDAVVNEEVSIGNGTVVMDGAVIQPMSRVGAFCIVNTSCSIDHDCTIGDFVHVAPGVTISGGVEIGNDVLVGAGSTIIQGVRICSNVLIGAGSVVYRDIVEPGLYIGNPLRKVR